MHADGPSPRFDRTPSDAEITVVAEECLVSDDRDGLTPAQLVERKLVWLLRSTRVPVSRLQSGAGPKRTLE
jgi:hypothetical protein